MRITSSCSCAGSFSLAPHFIEVVPVAHYRGMLHSKPHQISDAFHLTLDILGCGPMALDSDDIKKREIIFFSNNVH